ncbi:regulator of chromosome condensation (RCC1) repeat domain-containing protein [Ditylenchus destructor]|nr:regulator of chromosome condensation (RCC1) repeat domain-containing protein [Ditylenchus destructor]
MDIDQHNPTVDNGTDTVPPEEQSDSLPIESMEIATASQKEEGCPPIESKQDTPLAAAATNGNKNGIEAEEKAEFITPASIQNKVSLNEGKTSSPRGRKPKKRKASSMISANDTLNGSSILETSQASTGARKRFMKYDITTYALSTPGVRILSCGEGEQIGHPGRTVTRKPRAVDTFPEGTKFVQVAAGGVHSVILTDDGKVYSCGVNEKGTVPVIGLELEETTDNFTEIAFGPKIAKEGKVVQITAGASFSAALTQKGSVIAWGNLRDQSGDVTAHKTLADIQKEPVVVVAHKSKVIVKIAAGENHLAMLSNEGELLTFGDGSMGQLGRSSRTEHIRPSYMADSSGKHLTVSLPLERGRIPKFTDVFAGGYWTMAKLEDGRLFACGLDNFGQLGTNPTVEKDTENEEINRVPKLKHATAFPSDKNWTHIAGIQHIVCRDQDGEIYAIGKNTDNALGIGTWVDNNDLDHWCYRTLQRVTLPEGIRAAGVTASLGSSIVWTDEGKVFAFGYDSVGQLGLGLKDDDEKIVPTPQEVRSLHLDDYRVIDASISANHALFLADQKK